ncbi:MAG: glycosyltransferase [Clostridia bacterium]|nr:glycosyltransferase [Clostridia bacterium]
MMRKIISVITPFYQGNSYMNSLLKMISANCKNLNENYEVEYIIINDSPDINVQYDSDLVGDFKFYIYVNNINIGIHKSKIAGLSYAKGEYILFLDQDDKIEETYLASQIECIGNHDLVISNGYKESVNKRKVIFKNTISIHLATNKSFALYYGNMIVSLGQCLIKRSSIPELWLRNTLTINGSDDYYLLILMHLNKRKFKINPEKLYTHTLTGINVSNDADLLYNSVQEFSNYLIGYEKYKRSIKVMLRRIEFKKALKTSKAHSKIFTIIHYFPYAIYYYAGKILIK